MDTSYKDKNSGKQYVSLEAFVMDECRKETYLREKGFHKALLSLENVKDDEYAAKLYSALCNMRWRPITIRHRLKDVWTYILYIFKTLYFYLKDWADIDSKPVYTRYCYSCTWRYAGGLVAELREKGESYLDFYCGGKEGYVDTEIEEDLKRLGWEPYPWPGDDMLIIYNEETE